MLNHLPGFERYLRILQGLAEKSIAVYTSKVKEFVEWLKGKDMMSSSDIPRHAIEKYLEWCFYKGNSQNTRHTKLIALSKFFGYLRYEGIIEADPTADIPRPRLIRKFIQKFTREDILSLFRVIDISKEKGIRDACILILGAFCGFRADEIIRRTMNDIVDDGKDLDINIPETKQRASRTVYLWKAPALFLRQYYLIRLNQGAGPDDPFLSSYKRTKATGRPLTHAAIDNLFKNLAVSAGVRKPRVRLHMLRATHASDLRHVKGYDTAAICDRLGWKHFSSAEPYFPSRDRIHRTYNSLHEYWIDFPKIWKKEDDNANGGDNGKG